MNLKKLVRSLYYRLYIPLKQKRYQKLKYLLVKGSQKNGGTLVVSFSGFPGDGPARYNYINTLKNIDAHRLFILDDFGYKKQGSYYLAEKGDWFVEKQTIELIADIKARTGAQKVITIGSSKGGTAALYFSIKAQADCCIIGSPQYYLGTYLDRDTLRPVLEGIMGNTGEESVKKLNCLLPECICAEGCSKPEVYLHYSPAEKAYTDHLADMLSQLKNCGYTVYEDNDYDYTSHSDVAKFFPPYLSKTLKKII